MINLLDRIKLLFRKDKELYLDLYKMLGFLPHDISLYHQALAHKSQAYELQNGNKLNNERLEFLGDAIIEAVVSDIVYHHFPKKREGFLTNTRSKMVQRSTLNKLSKDMGLNTLISQNVTLTGHKNNLGGNAFEAVVGAIYLDRGYKDCKWFIKKRILSNYLDLDKVANKEMNFKSKLIEWTQKNRFTVEFNFQIVEGSTANTPIFESEIKIEGLVVGNGRGYSKKESHQKAASATLVTLKKNKSLLDAILKKKEERTAMEANLVVAVPSVHAKGVSNDKVEFSTSQKVAESKEIVKDEKPSYDKKEEKNRKENPRNVKSRRRLHQQEIEDEIRLSEEKAYSEHL